jgi:guanylate kinase
MSNDAPGDPAQGWDAGNLSSVPHATRRGVLFVVSAPSGTGKTTLVERLVERVPDLALSRSYTSRAARRGEVHGHDYHFISRRQFEEMIASGAFLEWADVFENYYGTSSTDTDRLLDAGKDVVLVIDVQGARQVRERRPAVRAVFVLPPSFSVLEARLRGRSQDPEEAIRRRLQVARAEVRAFTEYDYVVVNDEIEPAVRRLEAIITAERCGRAAMRARAEDIIRTFEKSYV